MPRKTRNTQALATTSAQPLTLPTFPADGLVTVRTGRIGDREQPVVDARELYATLGVADHFRSWMSRRLKDYGFQEDSDFRAFLRESPGGRPSKEYDLTLDMAKEIAMVEKSDKGRQVRRYFIACEQRLIELLQAQARANASPPVPALPGVPAALRPRAKVLYRDRVAAVVALRAELEAEAGHAVSLRQIARTLAERGSAVDAASVVRYIYAADLIDLLPRAFGAGGSDHLVRVIRQVERRIETLLTTHRRADQVEDEVHVWRTHLADHDAPRIGPRLARAALTGYAPSLARRLRQPTDRIEAALSA